MTISKIRFTVHRFYFRWSYNVKVKNNKDQAPYLNMHNKPNNILFKHISIKPKLVEIHKKAQIYVNK